MPMPTGRYGAGHIAQWSVSLALCEATRCRHQVCARSVSARRTPLSSPSPSCENTKHKNKTLLLASKYRTFLLTNQVTFGTWNRPSTQLIVVTTTVGAKQLTNISSYQTLRVDKNWWRNYVHGACKKSWLIYEPLAVQLLWTVNVGISCQGVSADGGEGWSSGRWGEDRQLKKRKFSLSGKNSLCLECNT